MPVKCCVFKCKNYNDAKAKKNNISFHDVPKNDPKRTKWLKVIPRKHGLIQEFAPQSADLRVCSEHFETTDFDPDSKLLRKRLKYEAIPSKFPERKNCLGRFIR